MGIRLNTAQVTGAFPTQRASNAENVSIWWRHYDIVWSGKLVKKRGRNVKEIIDNLSTRIIYPTYGQVTVMNNQVVDV